MKPFAIHSSDTVSALNHMVASHLPHLKFRLIDSHGLTIDGIRENLTLGSLIPKPKTLVIQIDPDLTVAELESLWMEKWGLRIDVYRRNGYTWSDTDNTRHWTLQQQNDKGEELLRKF